MPATPKHFIPTSEHLLLMIANAEAKFDADCEQASLRKEARDNARMEQAWTAQAKSIARRALAND